MRDGIQRNVAWGLRHHKDRLRKEIRARREALSYQEKRNLSRKIVQNFLETTLFSEAQTIFLYISFGSEVETPELIGKAILRGKRVGLPRTHLRERKLTFHRLYGLGELIPGPYGLPEPPETNPEIPLEEADLVVVPGVAFDRKGHRLGYGGGFYDRTLSGLAVPKVALAFSLQILSEIPHESHDLQVDMIITEKGIILTGGPRPDPPDGPAPSVLPKR